MGRCLCARDGASRGRRAAAARGGSGAGAAAGQVLLRVSACGVCRTDLHVVDGELPHPKLPLVPGHQVVGRTEDGRRLGVPWLGWTDGDLPLLPLRPREPLRVGPLHRLRPRRRLRGVGRRRRALLPADARRIRRPAGGAAPLRRADRLPLAPARGRPRAARALRLRRLGAHRRPGGAARRAARVRLRPARRRRGRGVRARARLRVGGPVGRAGAGGARRRDHLRAGRRARARGAARARPRRRRRLRRHPHERHPELPVRAALGGARRALGREPDPPRRRGVPRPRAARAGAHRGRGVPARAGERGARTACAEGRSGVPPC